MLNLLKSLNIISPVWNDAPEPWQLGFQDGASPSYEGIVELHDQIMFYLVIILLGVSWVLSSVILNFNSNSNKIVHKYHNHGTLIELVWTITPALILVAIAFPSFKLLYLMDEVISPTMTVKVAGHQWYWSTHQNTSDYQSNLFLDSNTSADHAQLAVLSGITSMSLQCADVDVRSLTPQDIPCVPSKNHENTLA